jgi:hypothetical protein
LDQRGLVFFRRQPPDRADHPGVSGNPELVAYSAANAGAEREGGDIDAVGDHVQPRLVAVVIFTGNRRGRGRYGDVGVDQLRSGPPQQAPPEAVRVSAVFGVNQSGSGEPARRSAVDQGLRIVRVHDLHALAHEQLTEPDRKRDVEARALGNGQRFHPRFQERLGERTFGRRSQRHCHHSMTGSALCARQVDGHPLLPAQPERRQHVYDVHSAHLPTPRSMTKGVFTMIDSSNERNVQNFSSADT